MLVAARNAVFSVAYVKVGLTPDGGATAFLAEFVSRQVLTELCLTGERISGERLHAWAPSTVWPNRARRWQALALAAQVATGPDVAMGRIKALCRSAYAQPLDDQLELEASSWCSRKPPKNPAKALAHFWKSARPILYACADQCTAHRQ